MTRRVTSIDVAHRAGVSQTTVSFVLNGRDDVRISPETRARVLAAAAALGYRPNHLARSLVRQRTQVIGVIVPVLDSYTAGIVDGIQGVCAREGYQVLLTHSRHSPDLEASQADLLLEYRVQGVLCLPSEHTLPTTHRWLSALLAERVACVMVDKHAKDLPVDYVVGDDYGGAVAAVRHLLHLGHRRIGHLSGGTGTSSARDRADGYRAALASAGIAPDEALVRGDTFDVEGASAAMEALLDLPEPPTAVFAASDHMALAAVDAAMRHDRRVPEDMAVVGFGDIQFARYMRLTTVHQSAQAMGQRAAERLLARLADPNLPPEGIVLPTYLVVRHSCGASRIAPAAHADATGS